MSTSRNKRLPISCEPCRIRKIRCSRDAAPCATCLRRNIPDFQCIYAKPPPVPLRNNRGSSGLISPRSIAQSASSSQTDLDLAERVRKLEQMLQFQSESRRPPAQSICPEAQYCSPVSTQNGDHATDRSAESANTVPCQPVGRLRVTGSGHVHYSPRSSEWSCSAIGTSLETQGPTLDPADGPFPFGQGNRKTTQDLLTQLPPVKLCTELKNVFFQSFAPLFHLLHDPTFNEEYSCFEKDPASMSLAWLALLFAMIGTSVIALDAQSHILHDLSRKSSTSAKIDDLSERYRAAAMQCLEADNYMWQHSVTTLQALIILIYGINHSHGQTWTMLGLTHNLALSIGCHVDPSYFHLDVVESEERRRCWAGLMMLYTVQNTSMGNLGLPRVSANVRAPADVNDNQLVPGQHELPTSTDSASQMSYLLLKFRLYNVCSEICSQVLNVSQPSPADIKRLDDIIMAEQKHWESKYFIHTRSTDLPIHHVVHLNILYGYSHQLTLLLHRPALMNRSTPAPAQYEISRQRCLASAKGLLDINSSFYRCTDFASFSWYNRGLGSFHAFHAAMTLILILSDCKDTATCSELKHIIRDCEERFDNMADLSLLCRRAAPILRHFLARMGSEPGNISHADLLDSTPSRTQNHSSPAHVHGLNSSNNETQNAANNPLSDPNSIDLLLDQLQPQQWLTPGGMAWDQWEFCFENYAVPMAV